MRAARAAPIATKLPGRGIEPGARRKTPLPRFAFHAGQHHPRIHNFGALPEGAGSRAIDPGFIAKARLGDRQADRGAAGNPLDPVDQAIGTRFETKGQSRRAARVGHRLRPLGLEFVDPPDQLADLAGGALILYDRGGRGGRGGLVGLLGIGMRQRHRSSTQAV